MLVEDRSAAVRQLQPLCFVIEETQRLATADEPSPPGQHRKQPPIRPLSHPVKEPACLVKGTLWMSRLLESSHDYHNHLSHARTSS